MKYIVILGNVLSEVFAVVSDKKKKEAVVQLPNQLVNEGVKTVKQSLTGVESFVRVQANEYVKNGQANLIREAMMKGYVEMSHINLSICTECLHAEYEAQHTTERLVSGG
nr:transcriptional regulator [Psychrobacillus antarcticus]